MFGQWALGTSPLGEPEELPGVAPIPGEIRVWFVIATEVVVAIEIPQVTEESFG